MIKVAADTNVYISAILFGGKPKEIRESAREGEVQLLISETKIGDVVDYVELLLCCSFDRFRVHRCGDSDGFVSILKKMAITEMGTVMIIA